MSVLESLAAWPVDHVSAAVITTDGVAETFGDPDRVYPLASVTKLLVAEAILVAVEEGAVELDDAAGPPGATIAHLLAHASGLAFATRDVEAGVGEKRIYSSAGFEVLAETVEAATEITFGDYLAAAVFEPLGMAGSLQGDLQRLPHGTAFAYGNQIQQRQTGGFSRIHVSNCHKNPKTLPG